MGEAAVAIDEKMEPRLVKVSSKRQITIPAEMFRRSGSPEYAYVEWHDDGSMTVAPVAVRDEAASVRLLRALIARGLEGDDLVEEYSKIVTSIIGFNDAVDEGLRDIEEGRVRSFEELQKELEARYGL